MHVAATETRKNATGSGENPVSPVRMATKQLLQNMIARVTEECVRIISATLLPVKSAKTPQQSAALSIHFFPGMPPRVRHSPSISLEIMPH
ncbi:MAG: hypothetical protein V3571_12175 [Pseudodesulfovibrio sp.]